MMNILMQDKRCSVCLAEMDGKPFYSLKSQPQMDRFGSAHALHGFI